jgi:hypothetical protein
MVQRSHWRRTIVKSLIWLAAFLVAGVIVVWPDSSRITLENCQRIQNGMTHAEVLALLGPPGDHRTRPPAVELPDELENIQSASKPGHFFEQDWVGDHVQARVFFDDKNRVWLRYYFPEDTLDVGTFESLRWRFQRLWHRWFPKR